MKHKWLIFLVIASLMAVSSGSVLAQDTLPPDNTDDPGAIQKSDFEFPPVNNHNPTSEEVEKNDLPTVVNGNFEQGSFVGWNEYSSFGYPLVGVMSGFAHGGSWLAWLGGDEDETSVISQSNISIINPTHLRLWYYIFSTDACGYDYGFVMVNGDLHHEWELCASNNTNGWVPLDINLSAYGGQTVELSIGAVNDESFYSNLFIDDVVLYKTFADVAYTGFGFSHIESIYNAGITGGCATSPVSLYCPNNSVNRAQMAIFLLRGIHGSAYTPPPATGTVFNDVPSNAFAAAWIEQLAAEGITGGCGGGNYCPNNAVTRSQMAIFLLRAKYGSSHTPPAATGTVFADIPSNAFAAAWIEQLAGEGITGGCGGGNYCPNNSVIRSQMAIFLQRTFNLPLP
jgi:hypothetical protein